MLSRGEPGSTEYNEIVVATAHIHWEDRKCVSRCSVQKSCVGGNRREKLAGARRRVSGVFRHFCDRLHTGKLAVRHAVPWSILGTTFTNEVECRLSKGTRGRFPHGEPYNSQRAAKEKESYDGI